MSPKLVLFDFDGTLADSYAFVLTLIPSLTQKFHLKNINDEDIELLRNMGAKEVMKEVGISWWKLPFMVADVRSAYRKGLAAIPLITGISEVLLQLKQQGHTLCVLTSNGTHNVMEYFTLNKIEVFDGIYGNIGMFSKPTSINQVVKKYHFDKQNVIYIGDEVRDIEAAKKAQVKSIAVTWGLTKTERLEETKPDYLVARPTELLSIVGT